jgi:hypothetical protein
MKASQAPAFLKRHTGDETAAGCSDRGPAKVAQGRAHCRRGARRVVAVCRSFKGCISCAFLPVARCWWSKRNVATFWAFILLAFFADINTELKSEWQADFPDVAEDVETLHWVSAVGAFGCCHGVSVVGRFPGGLLIH